MYLQSAAFAVRSNVATSTKCSPAELVLGSKLCAPLNSLYPEPTYHGVPYNQRQAQTSTAGPTSNEAQARQVLERSCLQMKQQYDKTAGRYHKLSVGDSVMLWDPYYNPKVSRCFQRKWNGPYTIDRFTSDSNCKIVDCSNKYKFVHVNQLKRTEPRKCNLTVKPSEAIGEQQRVQDDTVENVIPVDNHILFDSESESESENEIRNNNVVVPPPPRAVIGEPVDNRILFDSESESENEIRNNIVVPPPRAVIGEHWVAIDPSNIIHSRTRSGVG